MVRNVRASRVQSLTGEVTLPQPCRPHPSAGLFARPRGREFCSQLRRLGFLLREIRSDRPCDRNDRNDEAGTNQRIFDDECARFV